LEDDRLCVEDIGVSSGLRSPADRAYLARAWPASARFPPDASRRDAAVALSVSATAAEVCVDGPKVQSGTIELRTQAEGAPGPGPLYVKVAPVDGRATVVRLHRPDPEATFR
jgi:hypothetical protein